jgi:hypothetical protein
MRLPPPPPRARAPWLKPLLAVTAGAASAYALASAYRRRVDALEDEARREYEAALRGVDSGPSSPTSEGVSRAMSGVGEGGMGASATTVFGSAGSTLDGSEQETASASTPNFFNLTKCVRACGPGRGVANACALTVSCPHTLPGPGLAHAGSSRAWSWRSRRSCSRRAHRRASPQRRPTHTPLRNLLGCALS